MTSPLVTAIADGLLASGVDLALVGRAWARATPLVVIVPAFGLRALSVPTRVSMALGLAAVLFPALTVTAVGAPTGATFALSVLVTEAFHGLPLAVATAVPLWAATMAGGLADQLRGAQDTGTFVTLDGRTGPLSVLHGLAASFAFFAMGGPARALRGLAREPSGLGWQETARVFSDGIGLSIALAAPVLAASLIIEISAALVARAAAPAHVDALLAPLKAITFLVVVALGLSRVVALFP